MTAFEQPEPPARWLTKALAARYLTMSERSFDDNISKGAFPPAIRLPTGGLKWDRVDLDAAMERLKLGLPPANDARVRNARQAHPPEGRREPA
jgi:predicted DNA-binding transcriptional regulator AlpA